MLRSRETSLSVRRPPYLLALVCLTLASGKARAAPARSLDAGVSMMSYQMNKLADDEKGNTSTTGTNFYHLDLQYHAPLSKQLLISPLLRYMPESISAVKAPDGGSKTSLLMVGLPLVYNLQPNFDAGGGLAITRYTVHGTGGTKVMNNGTGQTTFALPGRTETSTSLGLLMGAAYCQKYVRAALDLLVQAPLSSERRTLSMIVSVTSSVFTL